MALLTDVEIQSHLSTIEGWARRGPAIAKRFRFPSFSDSIAFVNKVAELAEEANHHPDITINYRNVTLTLITHSEGGLTEKDFNLASRVEEIATKEYGL